MHQSTATTPARTSIYRHDEINGALATKPYPPTVYLTTATSYADRLWDLGHPATVYPEPHQVDQLRGADLVVILDKDTPARHWAVDVVKTLTPVAASIEVVDVATGRDITDHLDCGWQMWQLVTVAEPVAPTTSVPGCGDCEAGR